tara:strand:+ start:863 stop:1015 length:153 start_codon:yes stop_codon:yes gene_type:complete
MAGVVAFLTKTVFTEKVLKQVVVFLGDYLVASSKNKLDDALWSKVRKTLL